MSQPGSSTPAPPPEARVVEHQITSLNPRSITVSDYVDLSDSICHLRIPSSDTPIRIGYNTFGTSFANANMIPFSRPTEGFFYCASHPGFPLATEIRFKCTLDKSPDAFHRGYDLLKKRSGLPWSIPFLAMLKDDMAFLPLRQFMKADGVLPQSLMIRSGHSLLTSTTRLASTVVRTFGQPWPYSFSRASPQQLWIVGPGVVSNIHTSSLFSIKYLYPISLPGVPARSQFLVMSTPAEGRSLDSSKPCPF